MNSSSSQTVISLGVATFQSREDWEGGNAFATLDAAWTRGIRHFDTSALYGGGLTEVGLGHFLSQHDKKQAHVTTKCGRYRGYGDKPPRDGGRSDWADYSGDVTLASVIRSVERLGEGVIDAVFIHDPDENIKEALDGAYPVLHELVCQKVIGGVGVASNNPATIAEMLSHADFDAVMLANTHSVVDQLAAQSVFTAARESGAKVNIAGVFLSGILATGAKGQPRYIYGEAPADILEATKRLEETAARYGVLIRQLALGFLAQDPRINSVILGASSPEQLISNLEEYRKPLPPELLLELLIDRGEA